MLVLPERREEFRRSKHAEKSFGRDSAMNRTNLFSFQEPGCPGNDRPTVRADDAVGPRKAGVIDEPGCDGPSRSDIAQRPRNRAAGCDPTRFYLVKAVRKGISEVHVHGPVSAQFHITFPFRFSRTVASARRIPRPGHPRKPFLRADPSKASRMSLLLHGGLIVTQDPQRRLIAGDVFVENGRITAIGSVNREADEVIDCAGSAVLPGFVNLHHHVANTLLRGVADDMPLEEMVPKASAIDAKLTRRDVQIGALLGCVEMVRSGTTSFHDLFYWEDEVARAVRESGMRGFLSWVTLDEAFTTQHGSPLKNAEAFIAKQKDDPLVTPSLGVQGVYVASEETYAKAREIGDRHDVRLHTHLSETRAEVEGHRNKTGLRPVEWLEKIGFLNDRVTAAHCVWVTLNEVRILARHGVSVAHCPVSNMKLASGGVAPVPEMMREGVVVGLGTDSPLSNNGMDVFADMKVAALLHKATRWDAGVMSAQTVLDLATIHAARALRANHEIGSIEVGKRADLAVVSLKGAHTTPFYPETVISRLVYSCRGSDVRATIVDGQILMADGVVRTVDEADVVARAQETARELFEA